MLELYATVKCKFEDFYLLYKLSNMFPLHLNNNFNALQHPVSGKHGLGGNKTIWFVKDKNWDVYRLRRCDALWTQVQGDVPKIRTPCLKFGHLNVELKS